MFRLIILIAIFFAVYPMIGNGYEQFQNDFNVDGVFNIILNMFAGIVEIIDNIQESRG